MIARTIIRTNFRGAYTPQRVIKSRDKNGRFPFYSQGGEKYDGIEQVLEYIAELDTADPARDILNMFPEYFFEYPKVIDFLEKYSLSKELNTRIYDRALENYPCDFLDFTKLLMTERRLHEKEQSDGR